MLVELPVTIWWIVASGWAFHNTAVAYGMTKKSGESPITRYHKKEVKEKK